jgi:hypothetical protein
MGREMRDGEFVGDRRIDMDLVAPVQVLEGEALNIAEPAGFDVDHNSPELFTLNIIGARAEDDREG